MGKIAVTFTGWDYHSRQAHLLQVGCEAHRLGVPVEVAVLCSTSRAGQDRYPTGVVALELSRVADGEGLGFAVHFCGDAAADLVAGTLPDLGWPDHLAWRETVERACRQGRVQVNARAGSYELGVARSALAALSPWVTVIGQDGRDPTSSWHTASPGERWLLDASGGRGVAPVAWRSPPADQSVGYAGGLGPGKISEPAGLLVASPHGGWLDMESGIRRPGGGVDPDACCDVLREVEAALDIGLWDG